MTKDSLRDAIIIKQDELIMELSRQACNIPNSVEERYLRKKLASLKAELEKEKEPEPECEHEYKFDGFDDADIGVPFYRCKKCGKER